MERKRGREEGRNAEGSKESERENPPYFVQSLSCCCLIAAATIEFAANSIGVMDPFSLTNCNCKWFPPPLPMTSVPVEVLLGAEEVQDCMGIAY
jgi:hypothetical protein